MSFDAAKIGSNKARDVEERVRILEEEDREEACTQAAGGTAHLPGRDVELGWHVCGNPVGDFHTFSCHAKSIDFYFLAFHPTKGPRP